MTAAGLLALATLVVLDAPARAASPTTTCFPAQATPGPGAVDPFRPPEPRATELNAEAKTLYRQGKWEAARAKYRAALALDPDFLAPRLNVACSFVRQERFAEATAEVTALLDAAFVPWSREILEAADLGALKVRPEMKTIREALAAGAARWAAGLTDDLIFIARRKAPLRIPPGDSGVFILGLNQEIFAWAPASNRYRQLTAADGRVLALATSRDRRHLLYVTAEKLVRVPGAAPALRGVVLHRLDLATLAATAPLPVAGDVTGLELAVDAGAAFWLRITGVQSKGTFLLGAVAPALAPGPPRPAGAKAQVVRLTAAGTSGPGQLPLGGACPLLAREIRNAEGNPTLSISSPELPPDRRTILLRPAHGASLSGLPFPVGQGQPTP